MLANGAMGACMLSVPVIAKDFSLTSLGITTLVAASLLKAAYRHAQVVRGHWDLTDEPPKPKKKPEKAPASAKSSEVLVYAPA